MQVMTVSVAAHNEQATTAFFCNGNIGPARLARITAYVESRGQKILSHTKDKVVATGIMCVSKV